MLGVQDLITFLIEILHEDLEEASALHSGALLHNMVCCKML